MICESSIVTLSEVLRFLIGRQIDVNSALGTSARHVAGQVVAAGGAGVRVASHFPATQEQLDQRKRRVHSECCDRDPIWQCNSVKARSSQNAERAETEFRLFASCRSVGLQHTQGAWSDIHVPPDRLRLIGTSNDPAAIGEIGDNKVRHIGYRCAAPEKRSKRHQQPQRGRHKRGAREADEDQFANNSKREIHNDILSHRLIAGARNRRRITSVRLKREEL